MFFNKKYRGFVIIPNKNKEIVALKIVSKDDNFIYCLSENGEEVLTFAAGDPPILDYYCEKTINFVSQSQSIALWRGGLSYQEIKEKISWHIEMQDRIAMEICIILGIPVLSLWIIIIFLYCYYFLALNKHFLSGGGLETAFPRFSNQ